MEVFPLSLPDVRVIVPKKHGDHRGYFSETYSRAAFAAAGIEADFVQDNQSMSAQAGTIRALHYQIGTMAQAKLIRVLRGAILDVAVDIRRSSPTFGKHADIILSADNWKQMYVPIGFAHGFVTLEPNTEVLYKVTTFYSPQHERGILFNDPSIGVDWRVDLSQAVLSDRDRNHPLLRDQKDVFD